MAINIGALADITLQSGDRFLVIDDSDATALKDASLQDLTDYFNANIDILSGIGISDVGGLQNAFDGMSKVGHTHIIYEIT